MQRRDVPPELRAVAREAFAPRGGRYDPRVVLRRPVRALRGGDDGIAVGYSWRASKLEITVLARGAASRDDVAWAIEAGRDLAALDDDPTPFLAMVRAHPVLGPLARDAAPRLGKTPTLFESLAVAIIEQLVTTWEAREVAFRLFWIAGEPIAGTRLRAAPTAEAVRRLPMWRMRAIGVGARRAVTLHEAAKRGTSLERLRALPPEIVVEKLQSMRGVGPWTANHVARRALGWADAVPIGDLHIPRIVSEALLGEAGEDDAMLAALAPFRPHRARVVDLLVGDRPRGTKLPRVDPHRREPWRY